MCEKTFRSGDERRKWEAKYFKPVESFQQLTIQVYIEMPVSPPNSPRTLVRWRHGQIFAVWLITNSSYPWCFTGALKLRFKIGTSVTTTTNKWKYHLKTNIYTLENVLRLAHLVRFPERLRSTLQLECMERHLSKYGELKISIHMVELRPNRNFWWFHIVEVLQVRKSACRTCSTPIFLPSTNQILNQFWAFSLVTACLSFYEKWKG